MSVVQKIYELNENDFTYLCFDLLNAEYKISSCHITDGANDNGIDIYAEKNYEKYAILVKHKYSFTDEKFIFEINRYKSLIMSYTFLYLLLRGKLIMI